MAYIDKTYITKSQAVEFFEWFNSKDIQEKMIKDFGDVFYLYNDESFFKGLDNDIDNYPIWNTSSKQDVWIYYNCPLKFVQDRLIEQHSKDWVCFMTRDDDFEYDTDYNIWSIYTKTSALYFFKENEKSGYYEYLDYIIVYGTSYIFKLIYEAKELLRFNNSEIEFEKIEFMYYGHKLTYRDGKIYNSSDEVVSIGYSNYNEIECPKIKYSFDLKDTKDCLLESIVLSLEDSCYDITQYKDCKREEIKRYMLSLPKYVKEMII